MPRESGRPGVFLDSRTRHRTMKPTLATAVLTASAGLFLAGCTGVAIPAEKTARAHADRIGQQLRPADAPPPLPQLTATSGADDYLRFALLKHPAVLAAYYDWRASVENITPARSLPDPKLTLQADISNTLMSFMPGLMFDLMEKDKLSAMGREAAAASDVSFRAYVATVLRTAAEVRQAWIELAYVDEALRLRQTSLDAVEQSVAVASTEYTTGRGMPTLERQVLFLNQAVQLHATLAALDDRRTAARTRFKSALGLTPDEIDPPWPHLPLAATTLPSESEVWAIASRVNPDLASMRAMVDMTVAAAEVAANTGKPDISLGLEADLQAVPVILRPSGSVTLPVWRDKLAATIAAAQARRGAAAARLNAEQLNLAVEIAQMFYMVREADRMIASIDTAGLPNLERSLASSEAAYQSGMNGPGMISETHVMASAMRLERLEALRQRETAATDLLLTIAAVAPADTALLAHAAPAAP